MTRSYVGDRYRLVRRLGRGAMGEVWQAYDEQLRRNVALKFLHRFDNPVLVERFRREGRSMAAVVHERVIRILDMNVDTSATSDRIPYLVMEELPGPNLGELMAQRRRLGFGPAAALAADVATALNAAHRVGVVHRDIKPSNLMFDKGGRLKVLDFGIASLLHETSAKLTATGEAVGTPAYFSPEQAKGLPVEPASDIYSLGCVLFEMITGRLPFDVKDGHAQLVQRLINDAPRLTTLVGVPKTVDDLVARMLAREPERRPRAVELMVVLEDIAADASAASFTATDRAAVDAWSPAEPGSDGSVVVRRQPAGHRADLPRRLPVLLGFGAVVVICIAALSLVIAGAVSNVLGDDAGAPQGSEPECAASRWLPPLYAKLQARANRFREAVCTRAAEGGLDGHRDQILGLLDRLEGDFGSGDLGEARTTLVRLSTAVSRVSSDEKTVHAAYDDLQKTARVQILSGLD